MHNIILAWKTYISVDAKWYCSFRKKSLNVQIIEETAACNYLIQTEMWFPEYHENDSEVSIHTHYMKEISVSNTFSE